MIRGLFGILFLYGCVYVLSKTGSKKAFRKAHYECNTNDDYTPEVPSYIVDLDEAPSKRWKKVVEDYKSELTNLKNYTKKIIGPNIYNVAQSIIGFIGKRIPEENKKDLFAIAELAGVDFNDVVLFNTFYEFFTVCTSIIGLNSDGVVYHGRNLDFGIFLGINISSNSWVVPELLRALTVKITYQRGGDTVAEAISFVGYIGAITGMKPNKFSLSINERFALDGGYRGLLEWLWKKNDAKFIGFLTLDVLLNAKSYEEAKSIFLKKELIAPAYIILGSSDSQGCVITRERKRVVDTWEIDSNNQTWFMVQTNSDHTKPPPFYDDRVTPSDFCLQKMGRDNLGEKQLYNVLRTKPIRNMLTVYTAIMVPSEGKLHAHLQTCPFPCPLW